MKLAERAPVNPAWGMRPLGWSSVGPYAVLTFVLVIVLPVVGRAQGFQPPEHFFTLSFGAGSTSIHPPDFVWIDEQFPAGLVLPRRDTGGLVELSAGAMVANRLAILGGVELLGGNDAVRLANFHFYGGLRSWLANRLWVEGGLGPTWSNVFSDEGEEQRESGKWGLGLVGVVGYDLLQRRNASFMSGSHFVANVQARMSTNAAGGVRANTLALSLGFEWGW
jgi:hypothetical protein